MTRSQVGRTASRLPIWLLIAAAIYLLYLLFLPAPAVIQTTSAAASIFFAARRTVVFAPGECVTVEWQVDNIQAVFLNDQPQIGSGSQPYCPGLQPPLALRVVFRDGSAQTYVLPGFALVQQVWFWLLVTASLILAVRYLVHRGLRGFMTTRTLLSMGTLLGASAVGIGHASALAQTIANANWREASGAIATLITLATGTFALLLMGWLRATQPIELPAASARVRLRTVSAGFLAVMLSAMALILVVNPRGMYAPTPFSSPLLLVRGLKPTLYEKLDAAPDLVILGSSRAFTLSPDIIAERTSLSSFNMAVEGGRIEDILILARWLTDQPGQGLPPVLWMEVQEGLPREPDDIAARAPWQWLPYMRTETALLTLQHRAAGLFDLYQLSEAIYLSRYNALFGRQSAEWPGFAADGSTTRPPVTAPQLQFAIEMDIGNIPPPRCAEVNPISQSEVETLIALADIHHSALVFYLSPWNSGYYDVMMRDNPDYQRCYGAFSAFMNRITRDHAHVFFLDYSRLDSINGLDSEQGFYDSDHLTPTNTIRLIDQAAPTLLAAYDVARRGRNAQP